VVFPELAGPEGEAALTRLCLHAQNFTSFVSIEPPNALLLEIRGSIKLFGSLEKLHVLIDTRWRSLGLKAQSATLPATLAALWLARAGQCVHEEAAASLASLLAPLPLSVCAWEEEPLQTLRAMGVRHLGELQRLPRAGLAKRLQPKLLTDLDIAFGRQGAPRRAFVPRERFREKRDLEIEVEQVAYLEQAVEPLISRCADFLRARQAGVQRLKLHLKHRDRPATQLFLGLASITGERARLLDVVVQKLGRVTLDSPVRALELISGTLRALSADSLDAFAGLAGQGGRDSAPQLVERLRARLGEAAVYGVCPIAEHRPEAAWRRVRELKLKSSKLALPPPLTGDMPRPIWLLAEPQPLSSPQLIEGPERIESGWWDGKGVARDYYVARSDSGERLWVFQERRSRRWYLHGVFA
jgi:protein ImuB